MRKIISVSTCGVTNTQATQCNFVTTALCDDGSIWQCDDTHPEWRRFEDIPAEYKTEYLCAPTPVPHIGEMWQAKVSSVEWRDCEIVGMELTREGGMRYKVKAINRLGNLEELWWNGELRPKQD